MLTDLQRSKLTHYFNVLDFDNSQTLEKKDFTSIGENLALLWGLDEEGEAYRDIIGQWESTWTDFRHFIGKEEESHATLDEWLEFADQNIVNGSDELYEKHINKIARQIFQYFDVNEDGYISLDEFIDFFMAYRIEMKYSAKSFTKLDLDKDDRISNDELLQAIREFFRSDDEKAKGNWLFGYWGKSHW